MRVPALRMGHGQPAKEFRHLAIVARLGPDHEVPRGNNGSELFTTDAVNSSDPFSSPVFFPDPFSSPWCTVPASSLSFVVPLCRRGRMSSGAIYTHRAANKKGPAAKVRIPHLGSGPFRNPTLPAGLFQYPNAVDRAKGINASNYATTAGHISSDNLSASFARSRHDLFFQCPVARPTAWVPRSGLNISSQPPTLNPVPRAATKRALHRKPKSVFLIRCDHSRRARDSSHRGVR
jgi:hypothetical protein